MVGFGMTSRDCSLLKSLLGRMASATRFPCEAHIVALLAQVPRNWVRKCPSKHWLFKNPEFTQALEARQNAERLLSDTEEKAIRVTNDFLPTARIGHHVLTSPSSWNRALLHVSKGLLYMYDGKPAA